MNKRIIALVILVLVFLVNIVPIYAVSFSDIAQEHWAYENVMSLVEKGVISGYPDGTYKPESSVSRAEVVKLLICTDDVLKIYAAMLEESGKNTKWYQAYDDVLNESGLSPYIYDDQVYDEPISRIEIICLLKNFAEYEGLANSGDLINENIESVFSDVENMSEREKISIAVAKKLNIINGYEDGSIRPQKDVTRAEVAAILYRYMNLLSKGNV